MHANEPRAHCILQIGRWLLRSTKAISMLGIVVFLSCIGLSLCGVINNTQYCDPKRESYGHILV